MKRTSIVAVLSIIMSLTLSGVPARAWEVCRYTATLIDTEYDGCQCNSDTELCAGGGFMYFVFDCDRDDDCSACLTCGPQKKITNQVIYYLYPVCEDVYGTPWFCEADEECEWKSWYAGWDDEWICTCG